MTARYRNPRPSPGDRAAERAQLTLAVGVLCLFGIVAAIIDREPPAAATLAAASWLLIRWGRAEGRNAQRLHRAEFTERLARRRAAPTRTPARPTLDTHTDTSKEDT